MSLWETAEKKLSELGNRIPTCVMWETTPNLLELVAAVEESEKIDNNCYEKNNIKMWLESDKVIFKHGDVKKISGAELAECAKLIRGKGVIAEAEVSSSDFMDYIIYYLPRLCQYYQFHVGSDSGYFGVVADGVYIMYYPPSKVAIDGVCIMHYPSNRVMIKSPENLED